MGFDPASLLTSIGSSLLGGAQNRTKQYDAARAAQGAFDANEEAFSSLIANTERRLAPFLAGQLQPGELEAAGQLKEQGRIGVGRTLGRFGITGGEGAQSVGAQAVTGIEGDINDQLLKLAENRKFQANQILADLQQQRVAGLTPMQSQVDQLVGGLRNSEIDLGQVAGGAAVGGLLGGGLSMLQNGNLDLSNFTGDTAQLAAILGGGLALPPGAQQQIAPVLGTGAIAGLSNQFGGTDINVNEIMQNVGFQQALEPLGVDPSVLGRQTPERNVQIVDGKAFEFTKDPKTGEFTARPITEKAPDDPATSLKIKAQTAASKIKWATPQDEERFIKAYVQAITNQKPAPTPTDGDWIGGFDTREYRPTGTTTTKGKDSLGIL